MAWFLGCVNVASNSWNILFPFCRAKQGVAASIENDLPFCRLQSILHICIVPPPQMPLQNPGSSCETVSDKPLHTQNTGAWLCLACLYIGKTCSLCFQEDGLDKCVVCLYRMVWICLACLCNMVWTNLWLICPRWLGDMCGLSLQHALNKYMACPYWMVYICLKVWFASAKWLR